MYSDSKANKVNQASKANSIAGMTLICALLLNDLVFFGNLNLSNLQIVLMVCLFIYSFISYLKVTKSELDATPADVSYS